MKTKDRYVEYLLKNRPKNWRKMLEEKLSDLEFNRLDIFNETRRVVKIGSEVSSNTLADPVYQMLKKTYDNLDETFEELRQQSNKRVNGKLKNHKSFFRDFIFYEGILKVGFRTIDERTYNQFLNNGPMFAYEKSILKMEKIHAKIKGINERYNCQNSEIDGVSGLMEIASTGALSES